MSESQTLLADVNYIKNKVDAIEKIEILNLRSNTALKEMYLDMFRTDKTLFDVYKSVDGIKNQRAISEVVNTSEMSVSRKLQLLYQNGLVEVKDIVGKQKIYVHTVAEKAFGLSKISL